MIRVMSCRSSFRVYQMQGWFVCVMMFDGEGVLML